MSHYPVLRIPLEGVPEQCPHCKACVAFPLSVFGGRVHMSCPACHRIVAEVAVTTAGDSRAAAPSSAYESAGYMGGPLPAVAQDGRTYTGHPVAAGAGYDCHCGACLSLPARRAEQAAGQ